MMDDATNTSSENATGGVKKSLKNFWAHIVKFLKIAFKELIIFGKDFAEACKFVYATKNKNQCWKAIKRNWWKFVKYFGAVFVFLGLNLSLGTIGFVLGALIISKILSVTLPLLNKRIKEKSENVSREKVVQYKRMYTFLRIVQVLLPVVAFFFGIAHWWLLLPGLIMMFFGGFIDHQHIKKEKQQADNASNENKDVIGQRTETKNINNAYNLGLKTVFNQKLNEYTQNPIEKKVITSVGSSILDQWKNSLKDFFLCQPDVESEKISVK